MFLSRLADATADLTLPGGEESIPVSLKAVLTQPAITERDAGPTRPLVVIKRLTRFTLELLRSAPKLLTYWSKRSGRGIPLYFSKVSRQIADG